MFNFIIFTNCEYANYMAYNVHEICKVANKSEIIIMIMANFLPHIRINVYVTRVEIEQGFLNYKGEIVTMCYNLIYFSCI